jgi:hypothetical protein
MLSIPGADGNSTAVSMITPQTLFVALCQVLEATVRRALCNGPRDGEVDPEVRAMVEGPLRELFPPLIQTLAATENADLLAMGVSFLKVGRRRGK